MKQIILIIAIFTLCGMAMAQPLGGGFGSVSTNLSGLGLTTSDSGYIRYGFRIDAGYGGLFGAVRVKDTLGGILRVKSAMIDTLWLHESGGGVGRFDIQNSTRIWTGFMGLTGGLIFNSVESEGGGTIAVSGPDGIVINRLKTSAGPDTFPKVVVTNAVKSATDSTNNLVATRAKADTVIVRDSLMITPEGGIAVLSKNKSGKTIYRGELCTVDSIGYRETNSGLDGEASAVVYSTSILSNTWGYFVIAGRAIAAFDTTIVLYPGVATVAFSPFTTADSGRIGYISQGRNAGGKSWLGDVLQCKYFGINGRRDSLAYISVCPGYCQSPP